jgi:DNA-binding NtrC family response regulator
MTRARVLIADADQRLRSQLFTRLLDVEVFSDAASSANEGFDFLRDRSYGLAVIDLDLPNGEAYALLDRIKDLSRDDRPMVMATVSRQPQAAVDPDVVQIVMRKPIRLVEVAEMIRSCLDSRADAMARGAQRARRSVELSSGNEEPVSVVG